MSLIDDHEGPSSITPLPQELGSARGSFTLQQDWDAPLTDKEFDDLFGGD